MIIAAQWTEDAYCHGPPSSIYSYPDGSTSPFYEFVQNEFEIGICGTYTKPASQQCCYSSIDTNASNNVLSGFQFVGPLTLSELPSDFSGLKFCLIESDWNLFDGYTQLYLRANDECVDGKYSCSEDGQLTLYPLKDCSSDAIYIQRDTQNMSTVFGSVSLSFVTLPQSNGRFIWTAFTPSNFLIPNFDSPTVIDGFGCLFFASALFLAWMSMVHFMRRIRYSTSTYVIFRLVQSLTLCFWVIARFCYWALVFDSIEAFAIYMQFVESIYCLVTLSVAVQSILFVNEFSKFKHPIWKWINVGFLLLAHFGLAGGLYFDYLIMTPNDMSSKLKEWAAMKPYWEVIMCLYNIYPSYITVKMLLSKHKQRVDLPMRTLWWILFADHPTVFLMIFLQILVIITHVAFSTLKENTSVLGNDKVYLGIGDSLTVFLIICHMFLTTAFLERIKHVVSIGSQPTKNTWLLRVRSYLKKSTDKLQTKKSESSIKVSAIKKSVEDLHFEYPPGPNNTLEKASSEALGPGCVNTPHYSVAHASQDREHGCA